MHWNARCSEVTVNPAQTPGFTVRCRSRAGSAGRGPPAASRLASARRRCAAGVEGRAGCFAIARLRSRLARARCSSPPVPIGAVPCLAVARQNRGPGRRRGSPAVAAADLPWSRAGAAASRSPGEVEARQRSPAAPLPRSRSRAFRSAPASRLAHGRRRCAAVVEVRIIPRVEVRGSIAGARPAASGSSRDRARRYRVACCKEAAVAYGSGGGLARAEGQLSTHCGHSLQASARRAPVDHLVAAPNPPGPSRSDVRRSRGDAAGDLPRPVAGNRPGRPQRLIDQRVRRSTSAEDAPASIVDDLVARIPE
jgi:hypothetical protein